MSEPGSAPQVPDSGGDRGIGRTGGSPASIPEPAVASGLLPALRTENARLAAQNAKLRAQVAMLQQMHAELVSSPSFRLTAPVRRVQEQLRRRAMDRRKAAQAAGEIPHAGALRGLQLPEISADDALRHPLLARTQLRGRGVPISTPRRLAQRPGTGRRVLVIAHVYYPELWDELADRIELIDEPFDLAVSLTAERSEGLLETIHARFPQAIIETFENRGRDMLPLLNLLDLGLVGDYDAVLKVHTKKSAHRRDGRRWRAQLLDALCPSPAGIELMLELLRKDPTVGMIGPTGHVLGLEFWGQNGTLIDAIASRVPLGYDPTRVWFAAGSMFWIRPQLLRAMMLPNLTEDDFEYEVAALDGTTAHALERYVGVIVAAAGQQVVSTDDVAGRLATVLDLHHVPAEG
ncbi:MAG: rhamnan synthesis F family protein [Candidatus Nanopelagicales bacterium]